MIYARYGDRTLELDIYRPKEAWEKLPAIVCIHGDGLANGNRASHEKVAQALAARGFVAATISYRLSGEAPFPAAIHDYKAAVRFLRAHAQEHGIDADKIGAIGLSAGGRLTALLTTSAGVAELEGEVGNAGLSSAVQAAVPMGAQTDFLSERTREISAQEGRGQIWWQFLAGTPVKFGLVGSTPSLTELEDGDLSMGIDFREVYATLLTRWLGVSPSTVLPGEFSSVDLL